MGAWGTGIYDNDTTLDIHGFVSKLVNEDVSVREAIKQVIDSYKSSMDYNDIIYGLAQEQMRYDVLVDKEIVISAIQLAEMKDELEHWNEDVREDRSKFLDGFVSELNHFLDMKEIDKEEE